ncbi:OadG family protein [Shewanella submarina]|uniref:Probable oxaloacetate decarboxylase gamma chain n=1 Tax=Shewanella submarina TaxID=2016376 RepID=A0ABV7GJX1_9GAMM|nr:OadG family transporter subunit [Shewanella submarina]MCL1036260.1 OadG family protein [Shewanella submarina]
METITESLTVAFGIMAMGMVMVFVFLGILIAGVNFVASRYGPKPALDIGEPQPDSAQANVDPKVLAAITAAIHQYRTKA